MCAAMCMAYSYWTLLSTDLPGAINRACRGPDFGLSINEGQSVAKSMEVGTPGYCAPELLMRTNLTTSYDGKKADGALLHLLAHIKLSCADSQAGQWCMFGY